MSVKNSGEILMGILLNLFVSYLWYNGHFHNINPMDPWDGGGSF